MIGHAGVPPGDDAVTARSFVHHELMSAGAVFESRDGSEVASFPEQDPSFEKEQIARLALADFCSLPRIGFDGPDAGPWLRRMGLPVADAPNLAMRAEDGSIVARLSFQEFLILSFRPGCAAALSKLVSSLEGDESPGVYPLPRADSHAGFVLMGQYSAKCVSKLCAIDLRSNSFPPLATAQTLMAGVPTIVVNIGNRSLPAFSLLPDSSYAEFCWRTLVNAMEEFSGSLVGLSIAMAGLPEPDVE